MRIFISAVSSEFETARDTVASDLRARGNVVKVQSDFRQEADADTLLQKLHDYIRDCEAVVCLVGKRSGACPTVSEAAPFVRMLPVGIGEASYTEWEFFFARHFERRLSVHFASDLYEPDEASPTASDSPALRAGKEHSAERIPRRSVRFPPPGGVIPTGERTMTEPEDRPPGMYNHLFRDELHDLLSDTDAACTAAAMFLDNALLDDNGERAFMARLDHLSSNQAGTAPRFFIDSIRAKSRDVAESRSCRTNASQ